MPPGHQCIAVPVRWRSTSLKWSSRVISLSNSEPGSVLAMRLSSSLTRVGIPPPSMYTIASGTSASTVRPSADTSAKPPSTTIFCWPPAACTVRIPGRRVVTMGACSASTPKSPSTPGTSTRSTSPENNSFTGDTSSKWKLAIYLIPALADCETHGQSDDAPKRCHDRDVLHLATGERPAAPCSFVAADLKAQWSQLDL